MSSSSTKQVTAFGPEMKLFGILVVFYAILATIYAFVAEFEPIGITVFALLSGLSAIIGGYLWLLSRRIEARPSDREDGEIAETAGEYGTFSPHSWWPLVLGVAAALAFTGPAIGWWMTGLGLVVGLVGLVGLVLEFSLGQHAH